MPFLYNVNLLASTVIIVSIVLFGYLVIQSCQFCTDRQRFIVVYLN